MFLCFLVNQGWTDTREIPVGWKSVLDLVFILFNCTDIIDISLDLLTNVTDLVLDLFSIYYSSFSSSISRSFLPDGLPSPSFPESLCSIS